MVDAAWSRVQVFDQLGNLLSYFGTRGEGLGAFNLPAGMFIDHNDSVFIVDSYNSRVQEFQYYGKWEQAGGRVGMKLWITCAVLLLGAGVLYAQFSGDVLGAHNMGPGGRGPRTASAPPLASIAMRRTPETVRDRFGRRRIPRRRTAFTAVAPTQPDGTAAHRRAQQPVPELP